MAGKFFWAAILSERRPAYNNRRGRHNQPQEARRVVLVCRFLAIAFIIFTSQTRNREICIIPAVPFYLWRARLDTGAVCYERFCFVYREKRAHGQPGYLSAAR